MGPVLLGTVKHVQARSFCHSSGSGPGLRPQGRMGFLQVQPWQEILRQGGYCQVQHLGTHNAEFEAGKQTYWMAIYEHSDWTQEEFEERMLGAKVPEDMSAIPVGDFEPLPNAPSHLDYREEGKVTPVKNQGQCGSCWAFSATGALEGMWKQNRGQLISMSEQQMVDCG